MRGTSKIANNNSLLYISRNFNNLSKVSTQIALQQQVVELEDDPLSANVGIKMLNIIAKSEQYNRNIKTGVASLNLTDGYLASSKSVLDQVKELTVGAANATATASTRAANAVEMNLLLQSLVSSGNAYDGSRYIFGGTNTTNPPFTIVNGRYVCYNGNDKGLNILVDNNTYMPINTNGTDAFGNMKTNVTSKDMNPGVNLTTDHSTKLSDLNGGQGVPTGKIVVKYSAYPDGLEVDLAGCATLEDVKDAIEMATLEASRNLDPAEHSWLDGTTLDWKDLTDRYVRVTLNPDGNGISLQEFDLGEPLPEPTAAEIKRGLTYSGNPGYSAGGTGVAEQAGPSMTSFGTTVYDKLDYINYPQGTIYHAPISCADYANNKVAEGLGLVGSSTRYNPARADKATDGFIHGRDLNPVLSDSTLLADLEGYNDSTYTITNGSKPGDVVVKETSKDTENRFNDWNLSGVTPGKNSGPNGELYVRAVNIGTDANPEIRVEVYSVPIDQARASDLVATGSYVGSAGGGTIVLSEANTSGISGTVGVILPPNVSEATVNLQVDTGDSFQATVHVPAFIEEMYPNGVPKDILDIFSGWNITGLDKPPAEGYNQNHPFSTDLDGNISVNYRYDAYNNTMIVELFRPAFGDYPAQLIATGSLYLGDDNDPVIDPATGASNFNAVSGRIEFVGAPGFEAVGGSVYIELPAGSVFTSGDNTGVGADDATSNTYALTEVAPAGTIVLGGATELIADLATDPDNAIVLKADTIFKKGQVFTADVRLPNGVTLRAGTPLSSDTLIGKGTTVQTDTLLAGTVLPEGQQIVTAGPLAAGTVIPRGSYYTSPANTGFPADNMGMYATRFNAVTGEYDIVPSTPSVASGFDLQATFATVEDLRRAIAEAGIYVELTISDDGKSLNFTSNLAGAWLTVSEDTDCYEQMGDSYQQLTGLDLNGLVKGVNSDVSGNVYTEVVYYPPDPNNPDAPVRLVSDSGDVIEIQPGYYVRVYSDPDQMKIPFENRDNSTMVAEGFVPAGQWNPDFDAEEAANNPDYNVPAFLPQNGGDPGDTGLYGLGVFNNLVLEERNNSGVWGTVNLDYHNGEEKGYEVGTALDEDGNEYNVITGYATQNNSGITVYPGGLRPQGSLHVTMQEWDMHAVEPGVNCDYSGTFHGSVTADSSTAAGVSITMYKDSSRNSMTCRNDPDEAPVNGRITLYEVDKYGNIALDAHGNRIVAGTVALPNGADNLLDGETDNFTVVTAGNRNTGQAREENVFSTINDIIDALNSNDEEALHDLLGTIDNDVNRIIEARGDAGARNQRLQLLSERHADDVVRFTSILTSRVGMDDQALAKSVLNYQLATNSYQAAMQVSASLMQMSLLAYI